MTKEEELYISIGQKIKDSEQSQMFGKSCFKIKGKAFILNLSFCIKSEDGIGPITTCELIIKTGNFKRIDTARKAASYAGVCPFPNSTGKMVKKDRVSHMSDKALKTLLHLCAKSATQHNQAYKLYYEKKKQEGKPHYLILNNISNKLLRTLYSVILSGRSYDPNYICIDPRKNEKKAA